LEEDTTAAISSSMLLSLESELSRTVSRYSTILLNLLLGEVVAPDQEEVLRQPDDDDDFVSLNF
jgi:hypothetical protein